MNERIKSTGHRAQSTERKDIATRDAYGEALLELGKKGMTLLFLMQTFQALQRQQVLQRHSPTDFIIWAFQNRI